MFLLRLNSPISYEVKHHSTRDALIKTSSLEHIEVRSISLTDVRIEALIDEWPMGSYNSHGTKGEMTVDGRMDGTALASFLSLAPSFCMVCMQLHSLHEPSWPACLPASLKVSMLYYAWAWQHSTV